MSADSLPPLLPYREASAFQRTQALHGARRILDAVYPSLSNAQWQQALTQLQLPLQLVGDQASFSPEALATLVQHLQAQYPPQPAASPLPPAPVAPSSNKSRRQTYYVPDSTIKQFERLSYWKRRPISRLVNEALTQYLSRHPEAQTPTPKPEL